MFSTEGNEAGRKAEIKNTGAAMTKLNLLRSGAKLVSCLHTRAQNVKVSRSVGPRSVSKGEGEGHLQQLLPQ